MIYTHDSDFSTQSQVKSNEIKTKANNILSRHSLKLNDKKQKNTTIKRGKKRTEEMEWRNTRKIVGLLGDQEDMRSRIQLSNDTMESMNKIWSQERLYINQKLKIYRTIFKNVLAYNYSTWRLTKVKKKNLIKLIRKQLKKLWNNPFKKNIYDSMESMEIPLSIEMKKERSIKLDTC